MSTIATIRDQIQTRLETLGSVVSYDVATGSERLNRPCAIVFPRPGGAQRTNCDTYEHRFVIELHVSTARSLASAQDTLDALVDPLAATGIRGAIEGDKTLAGTVSTCRVGEFERYGFATLNGQDTLAAWIPITVIQ